VLEGGYGWRAALSGSINGHWPLCVVTCEKKSSGEVQARSRTTFPSSCEAVERFHVPVTAFVNLFRSTTFLFHLLALRATCGPDNCLELHRSSVKFDIPIGPFQTALRNDILETLRSWKPHLPQVTRIFTAAPGSNEAVLFETEASPLQRGDPRVVKIPFVTRRPTLSEAKRVITALLAVTEAEAAPQLPAKVLAVSGIAKLPVPLVTLACALPVCCM